MDWRPIVFALDFKAFISAKKYNWWVNIGQWRTDNTTLQKYIKDENVKKNNHFDLYFGSTSL